VVAAGAAEDEPECFPVQSNRFWRVAVAWWHSWLLQQFGQEGILPKDLLDLIYCTNPEELKHIGYFLTGLCGQDFLPKELRDKSVCGNVCTKLAQDLGPDRLRRLLSNTDTATGTVDWSKAGPYTIEWMDDIAVSISHISGCTMPVGRSAMFTKEWVPDEM
jgi:hypothetical protein